MDKKQTVIIRGKASYAKILGNPVPNYSKDGLEWTMDLEIDAATAKEMKKYGIADRVKEKDGYLNGNPYMRFKQSANRKDGSSMDPPTVKDAAGNTWDQSKLIGNGSTVDVKFSVVDYGPGKKAGVYLQAVRVLDLVTYEREEFSPLSEDDEFFRAAVEEAA